MSEDDRMKKGLFAAGYSAGLEEAEEVLSRLIERDPQIKAAHLLAELAIQRRIYREARRAIVSGMNPGVVDGCLRRLIETCADIMARAEGMKADG